MIEKLKLQNFKVLRDVDAKLRPLTVIVGPNGSGKASILQALQLLTGRFRRDLLPGGFSALRSRLSDGPISVHCSGSTALKEPFDSYIAIRGDYAYGEGDDLPFQAPAPVLRLDVRKLAAPTCAKSTGLDLPSDGEGLSSVLAGLHLEDVSRFHRLAEQLKSVIPQVEGLYVRRAALGKGVAEHEVFLDITGAPGIPASAVGNGILLTLGLLTALTTDASPLIMINDFGGGLHPVSQADLVKQIRGIQENRPDLQIIATSHSPYLLDSFAAGEVLLTALGEDGYAMVKPLTDHPNYERSKDFMDTGEFWSSVGEGWVTKSSGENRIAR